MSLDLSDSGCLNVGGEGLRLREGDQNRKDFGRRGAGVNEGVGGKRRKSSTNIKSNSVIKSLLEEFWINRTLFNKKGSRKIIIKTKHNRRILSKCFRTGELLKHLKSN